MDNGPLARSEVTCEFFDRIGVEMKTHEPGSPEDTGKIEIKWKQLWTNFESLEFLMDPNRESREYTLSDVHERLINYTQKLNRARHPNRPFSKEEVWLTVIHDGGVIDIEESAFDTAFKRSRRLVGPDGTFSLDAATYSVRGLKNAWVYVYEGTSDGQMMAEDVMTHRRYDVAPFSVPGLDEIRMDKASPGKLMREEAKQYKERFRASPMKGLYEIRQEPGNVASFPIATKEIREVADPFDTTVYASLDEARAELFDVIGTPLSAEEWRVMSGMIANHGLNKQYVTDLALEIRGEIEGARQSI